MLITPVRLFSLSLLVTSGAACAQSYTVTEITHDILGSPIVQEDMDGDGLADVVVPHWDRNTGRELLVHYQQPGGRFDAVPRRIEIKPEIIAVGFADLRPAPGKELLLFTNSGVFSLEAGIESYTGNLKPVIEWPLIASMPDREQVEIVHDIRDLDGDGHLDLLLPGPETYGYFKGGPDETFSLVQEFSTINRELAPSERPVGEEGLSVSMGIDREKGIEVQLSAERSTPFAGFVQQWQLPRGRHAIMESDQWMPSAHFAEADGDGRADIVFLNVGNDIRGQINLVLQHDDGHFSDRPDWRGPIDTQGDIRLVDFNNDELIDIIRLRGDGDERSAQFFGNTGGRFDFDNPDQVMRFSGYDTRLNFIDIDNDGMPELNVSFYTIPIVDALRNASVVRTQLLYDSRDAEPGQVFGRRPASRLEETFSASNVRGLAEQMTFAYDIDADGVQDAMYITDDGSLAAKKIAADLRIASEPFWQYVPARTIIQFSVGFLNDDAYPDLILRHSTTTSLLVSQP
ncbi:MAG: VCBS repeat-containing protein [Pseudohongiellaceae bacterium]